MAQKTEYQDIEVKGSVVANKIVNPNKPANHLLRADGDVQDPKELSVCEANLLWGGRNISDGYSPIDAAMVGVLSANLMAFPNPAGITVEYSRDAGVTWLDYGATDKEKIEVFSLSKGSYYWTCGKPTLDSSPMNVNFRLRVTLDTNVCGFYSLVNKVIANVATCGSTKCWLTILAKQQRYSDSDTFYETIVDKATINGWPGYNVLNFSPFITFNGVGASSQYDKIRFVFGYDSMYEGYDSIGLTLVCLSLYGSGRYRVPSNLARNKHLYSYDWQQNAFFPAKVESKEVINFDINNIEPTQTGNVTKTSTWLWQYLVQGVNWLRNNYLPASTLDTKTISDFSDLSPSQVNYFVDSTLTDSILNQKVTFPSDWKGRKICLNLAPVTFQKGWDYSLKVLFANYMKTTGARLFIENDLSAMVGVNTLIKIIIDNNVIIIEAYIEA